MTRNSVKAVIDTSTPRKVANRRTKTSGQELPLLVAAHTEPTSIFDNVEGF